MSLSSADKENLFYSVWSLFAGAILGYAVYLNTYLLDGLGIITYEYMLKTELPSPVTGWYFGLLGVLFAAALYWICRKASPVVFNWKILGTALLPLLILFPTFFFPMGFYSPMIFTVILGLTVFRLALIIPYKSGMKPQISGRTGWLLIALFTVILVGWFAFIQAKAVKILFMGYNDWGMYFNVIDNTLKGKWFYSDITHGSVLPLHFEPGMTLLLAPYVWLFRTPAAFFVLTSALLFCGGVFVYLFARQLKISSRAALALAFCVLLFPSFSNMNIAIFYGFHSLYVTIPLVLLYFYFFEKKNYTAAFCMFLISMTVKETVPIFWVGLGLVYLINGNRKFGMLLIAVGCAYFFTVIKVIVPAISPHGAYDYSDRYSEFGGMFDIMLAPFTKPGLFWGTLFRPHCIAFVLLLIIPLYVLLLSRPLLLLAGCITIGFVCLQTNDQLQNISIWYQSEYAALLLACLVLNYRALLDTYRQRHNPWFRALAWKIDLDIYREKLPAAVILSLLTTACFSYYFFGLSVTGKNSVMPILGAESCDEEVRQILRAIPPGVEVTATDRIGAHFILRNPISIVGYHLKQRLKDYVIIDVNDPLAVRFADPTRFELLKDKDYNLILNQKFKGHQVLLFHREPQTSHKPPVVQIPPEKWESCGRNIPVQNPNFAVRGGIAGTIPGERSAVFFIRLLNKVDLDVEADIQLYDGKKLINERFLFGDGVYPACFAKPGECLPIRIPLANDFGDIKSFSVEIRERVPVTRWTASETK